MTAAIAVLAGCSSGLTPPKGPAEVRDAGVLTPEDLADAGPFGAWGAQPAEPVDEDLPACRDLTGIDGGPPADVVARGESEQYAAVSSDTATTINAIARNSVLVYRNASDAEAAAASIDAGLYARCIAPSVTPSAVPEIDVVAGKAYKSGDESASYRVELDDYVFFEGTDNTHIGYLVAIRVQQVVLVFEFVYSGQYFEDVDVNGFQRKTIEKVTSDVASTL